MLTKRLYWDAGTKTRVGTQYWDCNKHQHIHVLQLEMGFSAVQEKGGDFFQQIKKLSLSMSIFNCHKACDHTLTFFFIVTKKGCLLNKLHHFGDLRHIKIDWVAGLTTVNCNFCPPPLHSSIYYYSLNVKYRYGHS